MPTPESTRDKASSSSGGFYALTGFYRQFLGSVAVRINVEKEMKADAGGENCEVFFALEEGDEDAVEERRSTSKTGEPHVNRRLIQFKFSRDPYRNQFSPQELYDIAQAFSKSQIRVNSGHGAIHVAVEYIVASNRGLSDTCRAMVESAGGDGKHPDFQEKKGKNPRPPWPKKAVKLLAQIKWETVSASGLRDTIERRAAELGVRRSEMDEAIKRVVGFFFAAVSEGGPQPATIEKIDALLADATEAHPLRSEAARRAMRDGLWQFRQSTWIGEAPLHSRDVEVELRELISRRGLVFIYGEGGNGKTSLVCAVLESGLGASGGDADIESPFRIACLSRNWGANVLSRHFARWRGDAGSKHGEEPQHITLERLQMACGDRQIPVLLLGLDALDEKTPDTNDAAIEELLVWARDEDERRQRGEVARGVLIVTSRAHPRSFHRGYSPYDARAKKEDDARSLRVDAFNPREMIGAAQLLGSDSAPPDLQDAVRQIVEAAGYRDSGMDFGSSTVASLSALPSDRYFSGSLSSDVPVSASAALGGGTSSTAKEDWQREIIDSLTHPTLWGCFCGLEEGRHAEVLRGEPDALADLSEALLLWFKKKIDLRRPGQPYSAQDDAQKVLRQAALALERAGLVVGWKREHWVGPATIFGMSELVAEQVWDEALSAGLISLDAENKWFWRHPFLARALIDGVTP